MRELPLGRHLIDSRSQPFTEPAGVLEAHGQNQNHVTSLEVAHTIPGGNTRNMAASERDVRIGDRVLRVREAGDLDGSPIIYFHGTPGSRLDIVWGDDKAAEHHVRLVTFDRPGYGGSSVSPFGLTAVGEVACQIADELGVTRFASFGMSGGGPFSLATAAVAPDRVTVVGVASGVGPIMEVPGSDDLLDDGDRAAHALLPGDPVAAAAMFAQSFGPMIGDIFADDADESEGTSDSGDQGDGEGGFEPP